MLSRVGPTDAGNDAGFTLLEVVCVLAIVALLAAIALPEMPRATTMPAIEGYAVRAAALLNADHAASERQHREIATSINVKARVIQSGATGVTVQFPDDVIVQAIFATRCNERPAGPAIHFLSSGLSCGGVIDLTRLGAGYEVRVNWLTGVAEVVPVK